MGLTGQLAKTAESPTAPSDAQEAEGNGPKPSGQTNQDCQTPSLGIYNSTNRITSIVQVFLFIVGLALAITYVYKASTISVEPQPKIKTNGNELRIIRQSTFTVQDSVRIDTLVVS